MSSTNSDEFFTFDSDGVGTSRGSTFGCNMKVQLLRFLDNNNRSIESLREYPDIARAFRMLNTAIPSSAPGESHFSVGGSVFTAKRNQLGYKNFKETCY